VDRTTSSTVWRARRGRNRLECTKRWWDVANADDEQQRLEILSSLFGADIPVGLSGELLRTADVAALFHVSERTVSDWARRGRIPSVQTPGGHRRYPAAEIHRIRDEAEWAEAAPGEATPAEHR